MPGETASVFLPSVPTLLDLAEKLETSRDHVIGKPHREEAWDEDAVAEANKEKMSGPKNRLLNLWVHRQNLIP